MVKRDRFAHGRARAPAPLNAAVSEGAAKHQAKYGEKGVTKLPTLERQREETCHKLTSKSERQEGQVLESSGYVTKKPKTRTKKFNKI